MNYARPLDINSPRGQETILQEKRAMQIFTHHFPEIVFKHTPIERAATVDTLLYKGGELYAIVENKCRDMTLEKLRHWNNEWLITSKKLDEAAKLSDSLTVPFYGFLYLVPDDTLMIKKIYHNGNWLCRIRREETVTQRNINGGKSFRLNAFIDMSNAKILRQP